MKKRTILAFYLILASLSSKAQKVVIHGKEGWRKLVWSDFTGKPDKSSSYDATTYYTTNYNVGQVKFVGDSVEFKEFETILELDIKKSWVLKDKKTDELLEHEQGHFTIGLIMVSEWQEKVRNSKFHKIGYSAALRRLFFEFSAKYNKMQRDYDMETNHSKNKEAQAKWNEFFTSSLANL